MLRPFAFLAAGWAILVIEVTLSPFVPVELLRPDGIVVLVLVLALVGEPVEGIVLTYLLGMMSDLFAGGPRGLEVVSLTAMFLAAYALVERLYTGSLLALIAIGGVMILAKGLVAVALIEMLAPESVGSSALLRHLPARTFATTVLFVMAFDPLRRLYLRTSSAREDRGHRVFRGYR